ncbi:transposase [Bacillus anthracis]|nr:transposase [Bacillus anthracis]
MVKFSSEDKIQIVLRYLNENESYREIDKAIGIRSALNWRSLIFK